MFNELRQYFVDLSSEKLLKYAGQEIPSKDIESILKGLHIDAKKQKLAGIVLFLHLELI